jgi:hypothetical protein
MHLQISTQNAEKLAAQVEERRYHAESKTVNAAPRICPPAQQSISRLARRFSVWRLSHSHPWTSLPCEPCVTSSLSRPSLDEIAATVLAAMAPLGHPVAERYVRSMRSIEVSEAGAEESGDNGKQADWVYFGLAAMSLRERDLACLRDATAATPRLTVARLSEALDASGPLRGWAALIAAARQQQLAAFAATLEPHRGTDSPLEPVLLVAEQLLRIAEAAQRQLEPSRPVRTAPATAQRVEPALAPAPVLATPTAPAPVAVQPALATASAPVAPQPASPQARLDTSPEPTPRIAESSPPAAQSLAQTVSALEATARKTTDREARAALYHRIGLLHAEQLGAPRSALESHLLAFMLDPAPYEHFVAVEQACRGMDRHKDLVHIYQSAVEAIQDGAPYPISAAELLWRCLQTQQVNLLRDADAANTAAKIALDPSADEAMLRRLKAWLTDRSPANDALIALVCSRLPSP